MLRVRQLEVVACKLHDAEIQGGGAALGDLTVFQRQVTVAVFLVEPVIAFFSDPYLFPFALALLNEDMIECPAVLFHGRDVEHQVAAFEYVKLACLQTPFRRVAKGLFEFFLRGQRRSRRNKQANEQEQEGGRQQQPEQRAQHQLPAKAAGPHDGHFLVAVKTPQAPDDCDENSQGQNGHQHFRHFQRDQHPEESGRQAAAGNVVQQFAQRNTDHDNEQNHAGPEESPEPFAENILLQDIQFRLTIRKLGAGIQFNSVFL